MFNIFKRKTPVTTTPDRVAELAARCQLLEDQLAAQLLKSDAQAAIANDFKNSDDPWVDIKSDSIDPIKGIRIELDWNDAFIKLLRKHGITGSNDEAMVQKWLATIYKQLMDDLGEVSSTSHRTDGYE
jgi:hypothetical protein